MFQFPANPLVGQVFAPTAGVQYKWNGQGWVPFATGLLTKADTDLLYVALTSRGAANGVATLDAATKVPLAQLLTDIANGLAVLDSATKIAMARLHGGEANGVATLDVSAKVPMAQLHGAEANGLATLDSTGRVPLAQMQAVTSLLAGCIVWRQSVGPGLVRANGQTLSKAAYPDLWAYALTVLTADQVANPGLYKDLGGDNFAVPILDGLFIRALGGASAAVGVKQNAQNLTHTHSLQTNYMGGTNTGSINVDMPGSGGSLVNVSISGVTSADGGADARPANVALMPCIVTGRIA